MTTGASVEGRNALVSPGRSVAEVGFPSVTCPHVRLLSIVAHQESIGQQSRKNSLHDFVGEAGRGGD
jgi:hypothetical protein